MLGPATRAPAGDPHAALHGLYWLLHNLSEQTPLLVAVDDLQWVDGPSLRFLHHLARRLDGLPVMVLCSRRSGEATNQPELLEGLVLEAEVLRPGPLSTAAVAEIVRERLGDAASDALCEACHESAQGNPFLLGELLSELRGDGRFPDEIDPATVRALGPGRIATAVLLRVGRLGRGAQSLARAAAVLGEAAPLPEAGALAGLEPPEAARIADALTSLGVLAPGRPLRFAHPVVRSAIYQDMGTGEQIALHRRAAALLSGDPELAAVHLLATDPAGDPATVDALAAAARSALGRGAPDSAAAYLRRALDEPPESSARATLVADLAMTANLLGQADAYALLEEAFELAEGQPARGAIGAILGHRLLDAEQQGDGGVRVFERSLEGLEEPALRRIVEALMLVSGVTSLTARRLVGARLREARGRLPEMSDDDARLLLVPVALDAALCDGTAADVLRFASRALGDGVLVAQCAAVGLPFAHMAAVALMLGGEYTLAEATLTDAQEKFGARGWVVPFAAAAGMRGWSLYQRGRLAAAEADARLCVEEPAMGDWGIPHSTGAAALIGVHVERGELTRARRVLAAIEAAGYDPETLPCQPIRAARAQLLTAEGRPQEALAELEASARLERDGGLNVGVTQVGWRSQAALCHLALGDADAARRLADEDVSLARAFGAARPLGVALRTCAVTRDGDEAMLAEAVGVLDAGGVRLEQARALVDLGAAQRRAGRRTEARATLAEGAELASLCGGTVLAERAREELRLAGARPRRLVRAGRDGLTPAELRVADLARRGNTNKEIAQSLFVTLRTVEMHLSNAYRKLGIEAREGLSDALDGSVRA